MSNLKTHYRRQCIILIYSSSFPPTDLEISDASIVVSLKVVSRRQAHIDFETNTEIEISCMLSAYDRFVLDILQFKILYIAVKI